jgi:hypothetical protein
MPQVEAATTRLPTPPVEGVSSPAARVTAVLDQVERNDDERMVAIAKLAYQRGDHGYAFFED